MCPLSTWHATFFPSPPPGLRQNTTDGVIRGGSFLEFCRRVEQEATEPPYGKGLGGYWTAGVVAHGRRLNTHVRFLNLFVLDYDTGTQSWDALQAHLDDERLAYCFYETAGCTATKDKWRCVLPLARVVDLRGGAPAIKQWREDYIDLMHYFEGIAGVEAFDSSLATPVQPIYFGHRQRQRDPVRRVEMLLPLTGHPFDHRAVLEVLRAGTGHSAAQGLTPNISKVVVPAGIATRTAQAWLTANPPPARGSGLHRWLIKAALSVVQGCCVAPDVALALIAPTSDEMEEREVQGAVAWADAQPGQRGRLVPNVSVLPMEDGEELDLDAFLPDENDGESAPEPTVKTVADLDQGLPGILRQALRRAVKHGPNGKTRLIAIKVPTGGGKTRAGLTEVVDQQGWVWATPTHCLGKEAHARLDDLGEPARQHKGILAWDGEDICIARDLVAWAGDHGWSPRQVVCSACMRQRGCRAKRGAEGPGKGQSLAPHALVPWMNKDDVVGVVYDELPPLLEEWEIPARDLLSPLLHPVLATFRWSAARQGAAAELQRLLLALEGFDAESTHPRVWYGKALKAVIDELGIAPPTFSRETPQPTSESVWGCSLEDLKATPHARTNEALRGILEGAEGWAVHRGSIQWRSVPDRPDIPVVLLDATLPSEQELKRAWPAHDVEVMEVEAKADPEGYEAHHIIRRLSRTRLRRWKRDWWKRAMRSLKEAVALVPPKEGEEKGVTVGVITHKPAAARFRTIEKLDTSKKGKLDTSKKGIARLRIAKMGVAEIRVHHFGDTRGYNDMEDVDLLVTLGDPVPNLGIVEWEASVLGVDAGAYAEGLVLGELAQAHGRARALRRTSENRVVLVHVGGIRPAGPGWDGAVFARDPGQERGKGPSRRSAILWALQHVGVVCPGDQGYLMAITERNPIKSRMSPSGYKSTPIYPDGGIGGIIEDFSVEEVAAAIGGINTHRWDAYMADAGVTQSVPWAYRGPRARKAYCLDPERAKAVVAMLMVEMPVPTTEVLTVPTPKPAPPVGFIYFDLSQPFPWPQQVEVETCAASPLRRPRPGRPQVGGALPIRAGG